MFQHLSFLCCQSKYDIEGTIKYTRMSSQKCSSRRNFFECQNESKCSLVEHNIKGIMKFLEFVVAAA